MATLTWQITSILPFLCIFLQLYTQITANGNPLWIFFLFSFSTCGFSCCRGQCSNAPCSNCTLLIDKHSTVSILAKKKEKSDNASPPQWKLLYFNTAVLGVISFSFLLNRTTPLPPASRAGYRAQTVPNRMKHSGDAVNREPSV